MYGQTFLKSSSFIISPAAAADFNRAASPFVFYRV